MIGTEGNVLATERFKGDDTQYYLYNEDIQGSTTSLVKEDGSADATYQYTDFGETIIHGDDQAKNEVCYTGGIYEMCIRDSHMDYLIDMIKRKQCIILDMEESEIIIIMKLH